MLVNIFKYSTIQGLATLIVLSLLSTSISNVNAGVDPSSGNPDWSYDYSVAAADGQMQWGNLPSFEQCSGHMQSPINIDLSRVSPFDVQTYDEMFDDLKQAAKIAHTHLHPLKEMLKDSVETSFGSKLDDVTSDSPSQWFGRYTSGFRALTQQFQLHSDVAVETDGHSVVVTPISDDPYSPANLMSGAPLPPGAVYKLKSFHLHAPSEHTINYVNGALEIHLVYELLNSTAILENAFHDFLRSKDFTPEEIDVIIEHDGKKRKNAPESFTRLNKAILIADRGAGLDESLVPHGGIRIVNRVNRDELANTNEVTVDANQSHKTNQGAGPSGPVTTRAIPLSLHSIRNLPPPPPEATSLSVVALVVHQQQGCGRTLVRAMRRMIEKANVLGGEETLHGWFKRGKEQDENPSSHVCGHDHSHDQDYEHKLEENKHHLKKGKKHGEPSRPIKFLATMNLAKHFLYPYKYTDPNDRCLLPSFESMAEDDDENDDASHTSTKIPTPAATAGLDHEEHENLFSESYARKVQFLATEYRLQRIARLEGVLEQLRTMLRDRQAEAQAEAIQDNVNATSTSHTNTDGSESQNGLDVNNGTTSHPSRCEGADIHGHSCTSNEVMAPSTTMSNPTIDNLIRDIEEIEGILHSFQADEMDAEFKTLLEMKNEYSREGKDSKEIRDSITSELKQLAAQATAAPHAYDNSHPIQEDEREAIANANAQSHRHHVGSTFFEPMLSDVAVGFAFPRVFAYRGSLTTPPCSQIVTWLVGASPIAASSKDIGFFWNLLQGNARRVQAQNTRPVVALDTAATHVYATSTVYLARARAKALVNKHKALQKPDIAALFSVGPSLVEDSVSVRILPEYGFNGNIEDIHSKIKTMVEEKRKIKAKADEAKAKADKLKKKTEKSESTAQSHGGSKNNDQDGFNMSTMKSFILGAIVCAVIFTYAAKVMKSKHHHDADCDECVSTINNAAAKAAAKSKANITTKSTAATTTPSMKKKRNTIDVSNESQPLLQSPTRDIGAVETMDGGDSDHSDHSANLHSLD